MVERITPLRRWLKRRQRSLASVARDAEVSYGTAHKAVRGLAVSVESALKLSAATGGEIKARDLCEMPGNIARRV
jgi:hypothetical protein